ncbi:MAG: hypothetical protein J0I90_06975 [Nitrosospira sp.]|nr:hypothetical protein [Nitrosospira sp.]
MTCACCGYRDQGIEVGRLLIQWREPYSTRMACISRMPGWVVAIVVGLNVMGCSSIMKPAPTGVPAPTILPALCVDEQQEIGRLQK